MYKLNHNKTHYFCDMYGNSHLIESIKEINIKVDDYVYFEVILKNGDIFPICEDVARNLLGDYDV